MTFSINKVEQITLIYVEYNRGRGIMLKEHSITNLYDFSLYKGLGVKIRVVERS